MIFVLSTLATPSTPEFTHALQPDKLAHALLFGILAFLLYRAFRHHAGYAPRNALLLAFLLAVLYGALDEFHQYFVPHRQHDVFDWFADTAGAAAATLFIARKASVSTPT
jgi:VanZ family protein